MKLLVAKTGFCFGITRVFQEINQLASHGLPISVGHQCKIQHKNVDWDVLHRIEAADPELFERYPHLKRVQVIHDFDAVSDREHLVVGHHGIPLELRMDLEKRHITIHDFQCPFIKKMDTTSEELASVGYDLIVFGKPANHHCVYASKSALRHGRMCLIAENVTQIEQEVRRPDRTWACTAQVTGNVQLWDMFVEELRHVHPTVHLVDTICPDSHTRQQEAAGLASEADLVVVVDDGGGASVSVFETCLSVNSNTLKYDNKEQLGKEEFSGAERVAVVGGILVPEWIMNSVVKEIMMLL